MPKPTSYAQLVTGILDLINIIIPVLFTVVFLFFVWKVIDSWVINAGDEAKRAEGKRYAITGVLVFVLMVITWGVVALIRNSVFGI